MDLVPFHVNHIDLIDIQPMQREEVRPGLSAPFGWAFTGIVDGLPVACGGLIDIWPGRAYAWALIGRDAGPWFVSIHRAVLDALRRSNCKRIEMAVDADFEEGKRWARLLGFRCETPEPMPAFLPTGRPAYLYARVS